MNLEVWSGQINICEEITEDSSSEEEENADFLEYINFQQKIMINAFANRCDQFLWDDLLQFTHFFEINSPPPDLSLSFSVKT